MTLLHLLLLLSCIGISAAQTGACCNATLECEETTEGGCAFDFIGPGTFCDPDPCGDRTACCRMDLMCFDLTEAQCNETGVSAGPNTTCDPFICLPEPIGACCIGDECVIVSEGECVPPALYQGDATSCSDQCQNAPGACCLGDGSCEDVSSSLCDTLLGEFQDINTTCANTSCPLPIPTPTPAPPVEPTDRDPYIIGIVVTVLVLFICGCCIMIYIMRRRRRRFDIL